MLQAGSIIQGKLIWDEQKTKHEVRSPYNQEVVGMVQWTEDLAELEEAIAGAQRAYQEEMRRMPAHHRASILYGTAKLLERDSEHFARLLALEAGKPLKDGRGEVARAVQLLKFAAETAKSLSGELVPMDSAIGGEGRLGMVKRVPLGVVAAITPFNFPLNLVLHKLAPAFAAGNAVVLKPAEKTPLSAFELVRRFHEAGLPVGALQLVMGDGAVLGDPLVADPRVRKVTFTGSPRVGEHIYRQAGVKKVTLELGSNSPNLVFDDADWEQAASSLAKGAFAYAGQVCISVQRILAQRGVYDRFLAAFLEHVHALKLGDPLEAETDIGPMITVEAAERAVQWIREAEEQGAKVECGGACSGQLLEPTVLTQVRPEMKVFCEETFAPVVSILPFDSEEEAVTLANRSDYGLQAGVYTSNIDRAFRLADRLETGGVWINEMSTYRQDHYPYGGVKKSGLGREGVKYALEEMTELKFIGVRLNSEGR